MAADRWDDEPIRHAVADELDRAWFARHVAEAIDELRTSTRSTVVSVVGPWGSGKSSVLNMVAEQLSEEAWQPAVFNPWLLNDLDSLVREFFATVLAVAGGKPGFADKAKALGRRLSGLSKLLGGVPLISGVPDALEKLSSEEAVPIRTQLEEVAKELEAIGQPMLVFVDDLDRLHPDELLMVLKLVRLVGSLPNVHYLLAYDERTVLDLLMRTDVANGSEQRALDYLEKIVLIRFDIPLATDDQLAQLSAALFERSIPSQALDLPEDALARVTKLRERLCIEWLHEPREIKRYFAQLHATWPSVAGRVDLADFLAVTYLRVKHPVRYRQVARERRQLAVAPLAPARERRAAGSGEASGGAVDLLLDELFPPEDLAPEDASPIERMLGTRTKGGRIGSIDFVDRYFLVGPRADVYEHVASVVEGAGDDMSEQLSRSAVASPGAAIRALGALVASGAWAHAVPAAAAPIYGALTRLWRWPASPVAWVASRSIYGPSSGEQAWLDAFEAGDESVRCLVVEALAALAHGSYGAPYGLEDKAQLLPDGNPLVGTALDWGWSRLGDAARLVDQLRLYMSMFRDGLEPLDMAALDGRLAAARDELWLAVPMSILDPAGTVAWASRLLQERRLDVVDIAVATMRPVFLPDNTELPVASDGTWWDVIGPSLLDMLPTSEFERLRAGAHRVEHGVEDFSQATRWRRAPPAVGATVLEHAMLRGWAKMLDEMVADEENNDAADP